MTERDALFAAILANPADDAPRLIYADWLDEQGQAERAEFIRVQCEIERLRNRKDSLGRKIGHRNSDRIRSLWRREEELRLGAWRDDPRLRNVSRWLKDALGDLYDFDKPSHSVVYAVFRRGFIAEVAISSTNWKKYRKRLLKTLPLEKVTLEDHGYRKSITPRRFALS